MNTVITDVIYQNDLGSIVLKNTEVELDASDLEAFHTDGLNSVNYGLRGDTIMKAEREILTNFLQVHGQDIHEGRYELKEYQLEAIRGVIGCSDGMLTIALLSGFFVDLLSREIERPGSFVDALYAASI